MGQGQPESTVLNEKGCTVITLREYEPREFDAAEIPADIGEAIYRNHERHVAVDFPSPKTDGRWRLTSQGWVGHIPLTDDVRLVLEPKVELTNLFRMLEYAYRLDFSILENLVGCESLDEFYERLANVLAKRVMDRGRKGFYRTYESEEDRLPYLRGRVNLAGSLRRPWDVSVDCRFEEHTADISDNQLLAWTLFVIARTSICSNRVLPTVRRAYRSLVSFSTLSPFLPQDCIGRVYNRLNDDYHPMHALCRFFLEHSGPQHSTGEQTMLPFLVNMGRLFEMFVAEWLRAHPPTGLTPKAQQSVHIDSDAGLNFIIDLVLQDAATGLPKFVVDTKYKVPDSPASDDVAQIVAYAVSKNCHEAVLVYPQPLAKPLDSTISQIRVRSLSFSLNGDLERSGAAFVDDLLST